MISRLLALALLLVFLPTGGGCDHSPPIATASGNGLGVNSTTAGVRETTFDDIKFDLEANDSFQRTMITPAIEQLFDSKIRIRGYIFPTLKKRGLKQFVLVRDNLECCFGPGAALYDCILVHMQPGKTAEFTIRPVAVEGTFRYEKFTDYDGTVRAIYYLDGEAVE